MQTDIGEAKITRTIFGNAKVRVVRESDKKRRAKLLVALVLAVVAGTAWQVWVVKQQPELSVAVLPLRERIRVSAPIFQPEEIATPPNSPSVKSKQELSTQVANDDTKLRWEHAPKQRAGLNVAGQMAVLDANSVSQNPAGLHDSPKLTAPIQHETSTATAKQPAPATIAPLAVPVVKKDAKLSPYGANQPSGSTDAQSQVKSQP